MTEKPKGAGPKWMQIYAELRRSILTCSIEPGSLVSEVSVATLYGCSPTPVRDAINHLRQEGLIVTEPGGRRQIVAPLTMGDVQNLAEARAVIEGGVFRLLHDQRARIRPEDLEQLSALAALTETPGSAEAIALNRRFHVALAALSANDRLIAAVEKVLDDSERIFHIGIGTLPMDEMKAKHQGLVDAIRNGDLQAGLSLLHEEAYGTRERVLDHIRQQQMRGSIGIKLTTLDAAL